MEPRKYRFRLLNGAVSRSKNISPAIRSLYANDLEAFDLAFVNDVTGGNLNFLVIGSDAGT